jgi:hypothetical protein
MKRLLYLLVALIPVTVVLAEIVGPIKPGVDYGQPVIDKFFNCQLTPGGTPTWCVTPLPVRFVNAGVSVIYITGGVTITTNEQYGVGINIGTLPVTATVNTGYNARFVDFNFKNPTDAPATFTVHKGTFEDGPFILVPGGTFNLKTPFTLPSTYTVDAEGNTNIAFSLSYELVPQ